MSIRLMSLLYSVISTTIMGIFVTAALSMGVVTGRAIIACVVAGLVLSVPVSWLVARNISAGKG